MTSRAKRLAAAILGAAVLLTASAGGPARAGQIEQLQRQVNQLQDQLSRVQEQLEALMAAQGNPIAGGEAEAPAAAAAEEPAGGAPPGGEGTRAAAAPDPAKTVEITVKPGLKAETGDGAFEAELGGRVMVDTAHYNEDKSNLGDGTELRRARLFVEGALWHDWIYKAQVDFGGNEVDLKDFYLGYAGLERTTLRMGNIKEPFSMQNQTSSKYITFMERGLPAAFATGRHIGMDVRTHGDNWFFGAGVFGDEVGADPGNEEDEGFDVAARGTVALGCNSPCLHLGLSTRLRFPDGEGTVRFRERPESHVTDVRFVNTGTLGDVDYIYQAAPELALIAGPFAVQGEYIRSWVQRDVMPDVAFDGWYAEASFFLTGESRNYNPSGGNFKRLKPKASVGEGGFGALELAARYSSIDLTDGPVLGGEEDNVTIGLNWYANPYVRFMLNAIWVNTDSNATGNAANLHGGELMAGNDDPMIFQARGQIDF